MCDIEVLRDKLHLAIAKEDMQKVLEISKELDREIVKFLQGKISG